MIPRRILSFWSGGSNYIANACLTRMREVHPGWEVVVFDESNVPPTPGLEALTNKAHVADWVRISELADSGGVWLDATVVCTSPITQWLDMDTAEGLHGFSAPFGSGSSLENSIMAVPPADPLMVAWRDEFQHAIAMGFGAYKQQLPQDLQDEFGVKLPYLTMHAAYVVVSKQLGQEAHMTRTADGPLQWLAREDFHVMRGTMSLLSCPDTNPTGLVKLRKFDRMMLHLLFRLGYRPLPGTALHDLHIAYPFAGWAVFIGVVLLLLAAVAIIFAVRRTY
jgi:hypothetical protein